MRRNALEKSQAEIIARIYGISVVKVTKEDAVTTYRRLEKLFKSQHLKYAGDVDADLTKFLKTNANYFYSRPEEMTEQHSDH